MGVKLCQMLMYHGFQNTGPINPMEIPWKSPFFAATIWLFHIVMEKNPIEIDK